MKIEAGLKYVARNGAVIGPANPQPQSRFWPWHIVGVGSFTDEGRFNGKFDHPNDLLSIAVERDNTRGPEINLATTAAEALQESARLLAEVERLHAGLIKEHAIGHRLMGEFCPVCLASPKS